MSSQVDKPIIWYYSVVTSCNRFPTSILFVSKKFDDQIMSIKKLIRSANNIKDEKEVITDIEAKISDEEFTESAEFDNVYPIYVIIPKRNLCENFLKKVDENAACDTCSANIFIFESTDEVLSIPEIKRNVYVT